MNYKWVGVHPQDLANGRMLAPGETAELSEDHPEWAAIRAMLIRPDGYIAWATCADDEPPPLTTWLAPSP